MRSLHERWYEATEAKDLDGIMEPVAATVVSYEHELPLEYVGRDEVREVCANGLDASTGTVTWTVPDLAVIARDDLAAVVGPQPDDRAAAGRHHDRSSSRGTASSSGPVGLGDDPPARRRSPSTRTPGRRGTDLTPDREH